MAYIHRGATIVHHGIIAGKGYQQIYLTDAEKEAEIDKIERETLDGFYFSKEKTEIIKNRLRACKTKEQMYNSLSRSMMEFV